MSTNKFVLVHVNNNVTEYDPDTRQPTHGHADNSHPSLLPVPTAPDVVDPSTRTASGTPTVDRGAGNRPTPHAIEQQADDMSHETPGTPNSWATRPPRTHRISPSSELAPQAWRHAQGRRLPQP